MEQEAADELLGGERDVVPVLGREAHTGGRDGAQAVIGESDAMRVAAEVAEELARAREGALGVDDPVLAVELILEAGEGVGVGERGAAAGEVEVAGGVRAGEGGEKLASEEAAEDAHRKEVAAGGGEPPRRVEREAPTRDDAVEVGVKLEVAGPGVEHGRHAEVRAEPGGIAADGEEPLSGGAEPQGEETLAVAQGHGAESGGEREDDVEVVARHEAGHARLDPARLAQGLALRAVAIAAGVVRRAGVPALVAHVEVPAAGGCAAGDDGAHGRALLAGERVPLAILLAVGAEDVGDVEWRSNGARSTQAAPTARHARLRRGRVAASEQRVKRALDAVEHFARDEGVADRGTDRAMAEEMLDRAELGAGLEEMGGEAVPERTRKRARYFGAVIAPSTCPTSSTLSTAGSVCGRRRRGTRAASSGWCSVIR